jgi:hypothetical protein
MDLRNSPTPSPICFMIEGLKTDVSSLKDTRTFTYAHPKFMDAHSTCRDDEGKLCGRCRPPALDSKKPLISLYYVHEHRHKNAQTKHAHHLLTCTNRGTNMMMISAAVEYSKLFGQPWHHPKRSKNKRNSTAADRGGN